MLVGCEDEEAIELRNPGHLSSIAEEDISAELKMSSRNPSKVNLQLPRRSDLLNQSQEEEDSLINSEAVYVG